MKSITQLVVAVLAVSTLGLSGCISRSLASIESHPTQPVMLVDTITTKTFIGIPISVKREFWACDESGSDLICTVKCDGDNDIVCPAYIVQE